MKAQAHSVEAVNPHRIYKWHGWEDVKVAEGKILTPGVIAHTTAPAEHPEVVAGWIMTLAMVVGWERVITGTDC